MTVFTYKTRNRALDCLKRITLLLIVVAGFALHNVSGQCNSTFYDTGGASGYYSNNQHYTQTYTAPVGSTINVDFISFNLETGYDKLYVYDGPSTSSPLIATLSGSAIPNDITSSGRYITFRFKSDNSVVRPGWEIYITCNTVLDCTNIPSLDFQNPSLISGTFGSPGSKYLFSDVLPGIADAVLTIVSKSHSDIVITTLDAPNGSSGGYDEAFQPIIDYDFKNSNGSNDPTGDKYVSFLVEFFSAGTNQPVTVPQLAITGVDIDGDAQTNGIREFIRSSGYLSYSLQSSTQLSLSGSLKALGPVTNYPQINENSLDVMISYNYSGVNSISFDYGANYNGANSYTDERYNSLFFKCYGFDQTVCQPVSAPTGISASRCGTGPVILASTGCNGTVRWFTSSNGGTSLHDGTNFITPILTATKTYYIECYDVGCVSDLRSPVTATINTNCTEICDNNIDDDGDGDIDCDDIDCGEVLNREFNEGTVEWFLYNQSGNSALFKIDNTSQLSGINSAYVDIATTNGTADWHTQLGNGGHSIIAGKTYSIYFDAKAASSKPISMAMQLDKSPWSTYFYTNVNVTTTAQSFYYEFTANTTITNEINLIFNIGETTTDIWIDNVQFKEKCENCLFSSDTILVCNSGIAPSSFDLPDVVSGGLWSILLSPSGSTPNINNTTGQITYMDYPGQYIATLTGGTCTDTVEIVIPSCEIPCFCDGSTNTGYADWSNLSTSTLSGPLTNTFSVPIPGHSTMQVTQVLTNGSTKRESSFTNPNKPAYQYLGYGSGVNDPMYLETNANGTQTTIFDFANPMGDFDLLLFDIDEYDAITITAKDANNNIISDLSGWIVRGTGDATQIETNGPSTIIAPPPVFNPVLGTVTTSNNINYNSNFIAIRPNVLISEITLSYTSTVGGNHVYYDIYGTILAASCIEANNNNNLVEFACVGDTYQMYPNSNVSWSSDNNSIATVSSAGLVTAVGIGNANLTYTNILTGCDSNTSYSFEVSTPIGINTTVSNCIDHALIDVAQVTVSVSWSNAPANENIILTLDGKSWEIDVVGGATSPKVLDVTVVADGSNNNLVEAQWEVNNNCASSSTYNVPNACSTDTLSCSILYLSGLEKPDDGDAWDHGIMEYILENNGNSNLLHILTKDEIGMGTYDPMNTTTFVPINLNNYELVIISATTEGHVSNDLINALKTYQGGILLSNYLLQDDLGMTNGSTEGVNFGNNAYTDNTTSEQILRYDNLGALNNALTTYGDPLSSADQYLWAYSGNQSAGENAIIYRYDALDILPGITSHGPRVFSGFHMNGIYANNVNGGALPSPMSAWFSPTKHLTLKGKELFDIALVMAGTNCIPEICDNGKDDDLDGLTDCLDPECQGTYFNPGLLAGDEVNCNSYDPTLIDSYEDPVSIGVSVSWEESSDNISWNIIAGENGLSYDPGPLTSSHYYRRVIEENTCGDIFYSNIISKIIDPTLIVCPDNLGWLFGCDDTYALYPTGKGIKGVANPHVKVLNPTLQEYYIVEATFSGGVNAPNKVRFTTKEGYQQVVKMKYLDGESGINGKRYFQANLPATDSVFLSYIGDTNTAESMVVYTVRQAEKLNSFGTYVHKIINPGEAFEVNYDLPQMLNARNVYLSIPLTGITNDGKEVYIEYTVGNKTTVDTISSYTDGNSLEVYISNLSDVTNEASTLNIKITSPASNGQTVILSGAISAQVQCDQRLVLLVDSDEICREVGDSVTYTYTLHNFANVPISNLSGNSSLTGAISFGTDTIYANSTIIITQKYQIQSSDLPGPLINSSSATGFNFALNSTLPIVDTIIDTMNIYIFPSASISYPSSYICDDNSILLTASPSGLLYQWDVNAGNATSDTVTVYPAASSTFGSNPPETVYAITVTDTNGCTDTDNTTISSYANPILSVTSDSICIGDTGVLTANAIAGPFASSISYDWSNGSITNTLSASPIITTDYVVIATDDLLCKAIDTVSISVFDDPTVAISGDSVICSGDPIVLTAVASDNIFAISSYQWSNGDSGNSISINPNTDSTVYVTVTNSLGCESSDSHNIDLFQESIPLLATASNDSICIGASATLKVNDKIATGGLINYSNWSIGTGDTNGFNGSGPSNGNQRINDLDPWGNTTVVWEAIPNTYSVNDGGWESDPFPIDHTKAYRISTWVKRKIIGSSGRFRLGLDGFGSVNGVKNISNGNTYISPHLESTNSPPSNLNENEWTLVVGYVFPSNHSGTSNHLESGFYTVNGGRVGDTDNDYKWLPETTQAAHNSYLNGCIDNSVRQQWVYPRFDVIDGTQPSIQDLLNGFDVNGGLGVGGTWEWYTDNCNGIFIGAGDSITVTPGNTTTYFVKGISSCGASLCKSVTIYVSDISSPSIDYNGSVCITTNSQLTANVAGGFSPFSYAWIGPNSFSASTQTVSLVDDGSYIVTITDNNGCNIATSGYINEEFTPSIISLNTNVCEGIPVNVSVESPNAISYIWDANASNQTTKIATVYPTPPSTTYHVTVTNDQGCTSVPEIIINATPKPTLTLNGSDSICVGETTTITPSSAGNWTQLNPSIAVINSSGVVTGLSAGKARFIFTQSSNNCSSDTSSIIEVGSKSAVQFIGPNVVCENSTTQLSPSTGGVWTSSNTNVATVNNTGLVSGINQGTAFFTFTNSATGCTSNPTSNLTVEKGNGANISGPSSICSGKTAQFSASPSNGTWISLDNSIATVNANTGLVTAVSEGTVSIQYDHQGGSCSIETTKTITIKGSPDVSITSTNSSCNEDNGSIGFNITNHPTRTNIKLSINNGSTFVTVSDTIGTYIFSGLAQGTYNLVTKWNNNECEVVLGQVTLVDANPAPQVVITSTNEPCGTTNGGSINFQITDNPSQSQLLISIDGGNTWPYTINDNIGTYVLNNLSPNTYNIYTKWIDNSCAKENATIVIKNGLENQGTLSPNDTICHGDTKLLIATGGVSYLWSNAATGSNISINPLSTASYSVTITLGNGCTSEKSTTVMVVDPMSANLDFIGGLCLTDTSSITAIHSGGLAPYSYTWAGPSGNAGSTKNISINEGGNYYLTVTDANGCYKTSSGFIYQKYEPFIINVQNKVCEGTTVDLNVNASNAISYQWSANAGNATTPNVTVSPVVPMSSYYVSITNNLGCVAVANGVINVDPAPIVSLSGSDTLCMGGATQLTPMNNGFWNSTNQIVAQVNNTGLVTGFSSGYADFYYIENTNYCTSLNPIRINVLSDEINGFLDDEFCVGDTTYLSPNIGGVWSTTNTSAFSVTNNGMVIALAAGQGKFKFTLDGLGCILTTIGQMTVHPTPTTAFEEGNNLCLGQTTSISSTTDGLWASVNPSVAGIDNNGLITGMTVGTSKFIFENEDTGCLSDTSSILFVSDNPIPILDGPSSICQGQTTKLLPSTGGIWHSTNNSIATITSNGIVNGIYQGTSRFYYVSDGGLCISDTSEIITIFPKPSISLNGDNYLCSSETTSLLPSFGGNWNSTNNNIATISSAGIVTAISTGVTTFSFVDTATNCASEPSVPITVFSIPIITLTGVDSICVGTTTTLSPSTGGVWTSSNNSVAIISASGIVTGMSGGTVTFTFKENLSDCVSEVSTPINIIAKPIVSITGPSVICEGSTTTLAPTGGGYWISSNTTVATVTASGIVTGKSQGLVKFTFVSNFGCTSNQTSPIIVNGKPKPTFTGSPSICIGYSTNLLPNAGGVWVSNSPLIASITNAGLVTGLSVGEATFTFTDTVTGCISDISSKLVVNNLPPITLPVGSRICVGATLNAAPSSGGTWQSTNTAIATISNSGLITGKSAGTARFQYQNLATGCLSALSNAVTVDPKPTISLSGPSAICAGDSTYMSPSSGGTWISNNPATAAINNSGRVIGLMGGISKFRFTSSYNCPSDLSSPITINSAPPTGLSGPQYICIGEITSVYPNTGGTWDSSDSDVATIDNNGIVTGVSEGIVNMIFTDAVTGCKSVAQIEIYILAPPTITLIGDSEICMGYTTSVSSTSDGSWIVSDSRIASISNDGIVTGLAPGVVEISFIDGLTGCKNQGANIEILISKCLNHDFNVTLANVTVTGDISTNDNTPINGIYNALPTLKSKPSGSVYSLSMGSNGVYSFSANKEGKYIFDTQVCVPLIDFGCPKSLLEITVLRDIYGTNNPVNNLEFMTTFANDNISLPGNYIDNDVMQNDLCVSSYGCNLNITNMTIINNATNGIGNYIGFGKLSYIPSIGYLGKDVVTYKVCSDIDPTNCSTSSTYITVASTSAHNSVVAPDDFNYILSGEAVSGNVKDNDSDPEGDIINVVPQGSVASPIIINGGSYYINSNGDYTFTSDLNFEGPTSFVYTICDDNIESACMDATVHLLVFGDMKVTVKAYLEGALLNNAGQTSSLGKPLMRDNLRQSPFDGNNHIPLIDPYTTGTGLLAYGIKNHVGPGLLSSNQMIQDSISVFSVSGDNAIVDWVYIELRSKTNNSIAIASRSALIQRDGDVVDLDGVSPVRFTGFGVDSFYIVLVHRNHLGVMSDLVTSTDFVDFTDLNTTVHNFGFYAPNGYDYQGLTFNTSVKPGYRALWAGDFNSNGKVGFIGGDDDSNVIITDVLLYPENYEFKANFDFAYGYFNGDYDMNSKVKFTNPSDDTNMLFTQVLLYTLNQSFASNFGSFIQQVPNRSN